MDQPKPSRDLFPKKLSIVASALTVVLVVGTLMLVVVMHRDFESVNKTQIPILEMASINLRMAASLESQTDELLRNPTKNRIDEYKLSLDALTANLKSFQESLEKEQLFKKFASKIPTHRMINNSIAIYNAVVTKQLKIAQDLRSAPTFKDENEKFTQAVGDVTEALSSLRDELLIRQIRSTRYVGGGAGILLLFLSLVFYRIFCAYRSNLAYREIAEQQVSTLSLQRKQLIHVLCHDLGNPIASITGFTDFLDNADQEMRDQAVAMIKLSAVQAQAIIDLIQKVQALESGKLNLEMTSHSLREMVTASTEVLSDRIRKKKLQVNLDIDPNLFVMVERTSFVNSVVNNIMTNAIKFSSAGSTIDIRAEAQSQNVMLTVRDHGIGMPRDLLNHVFSDHRATNRKGTSGEVGTGFGMPLVKKFVVAYGGDISVTSHEAPASNHGTEITLKLKAVG